MVINDRKSTPALMMTLRTSIAGRKDMEDVSEAESEELDIMGICRDDLKGLKAHQSLQDHFSLQLKPLLDASCKFSKVLCLKAFLIAIKSNTSWSIFSHFFTKSEFQHIFEKNTFLHVEKRLLVM